MQNTRDGDASCTTSNCTCITASFEQFSSASKPSYIVDMVLHVTYVKIYIDSILTTRRDKLAFDEN